MKKPKPPKTFKEVEDYIRAKRLNVNPKLFWDYFEAGDWHDGNGKPVLCWKQKVLTWHGRDKLTEVAQKKAAASKKHIARIREENQEWLENKSTRALQDLQADGGQISQVAGWLIDEILAKRKKGEQT